MSEEQKTAEKPAEAASNLNVKELGLIGKKVGMTQIFDEEGNVVPTTVVELTDNYVTEVLTKAKNGYDAVQVGAFDVKEKHLNKPTAGQFTKRGLPLLRELQEFRTPDPVEAKVGEKLDNAAFFDKLERVTITATSIGKGFQGGVKLHNHAVGRRSHGSKSKRQIGSIGAGTTPSRVYKGKTMPAMMGNRTITINRVEVVAYDAEKNLVLLRGPVPGKKGTLVTIKPHGLKTWNQYNKVKQEA